MQWLWFSIQVLQLKAEFLLINKCTIEMVTHPSTYTCIHIYKYTDTVTIYHHGHTDTAGSPDSVGSAPTSDI